jgi:hypothetical protein
MFSKLANDEVVVLSISGPGCDVDDEDKVRYLAHTIRLATRDVNSALARYSAPWQTMKDVSGM